MPSWVLASVRPLYAVWLNDLSSKPPESETMHALNAASPAPPEEADPLGAAELPASVPGACAQPDRASAAEVARAPTRVRVFFTDGSPRSGSCERCTLKR